MFGGDLLTLVRLPEGWEVVHKVVDHLRMRELLEGTVQQNAQVRVCVATSALSVRQEEQLLRGLALKQNRTEVL